MECEALYSFEFAWWMRLSKSANVTIFNILRKFKFQNFQQQFSVIWIFRDRKSISFHIGKLTFTRLTNFKTFRVFLLEAGGKPSTWFPPGALVELLPPEGLRHWMLHIVVHFFHFWSKSIFQILKIIFRTYYFFDTMNRYDLMQRTLHFYFQSILKFSIVSDKSSFLHRRATFLPEFEI